LKGELSVSRSMSGDNLLRFWVGCGERCAYDISLGLIGKNNVGFCGSDFCLRNWLLKMTLPPATFLVAVGGCWLLVAARWLLRFEGVGYTAAFQGMSSMAL